MKTYKFGKQGVLVRGDCLDVLKRIRTSSVDLVFADPPFNIGYKYDEYQDRKSETEYRSWTSSWIKHCHRVLKPTGSIFVAIGDEYAAEIKKTLDSWFDRSRFRNWIIWHYTFGVYCQSKFGRDHAHILYYTRDRKFVFRSDRIRVPSARQTTYADKRADAKGRVPGDVWTFPRVCGTFKERTGHPCQMPEALLERIIQVASDSGSIVLDPFCGSGTTAAVCAKLGRRFITCEMSKGYASLARRRITRAILQS